MTEVIESRSEKDTFALGQKLGGDCRPGDIVLLNGDLGVGKTVFTKGFGKGLGIEEPISSPTFTIMQHLEAVVATKKNLERKNVFFHLEIVNMAGIQRTSGRRCGSYLIRNCFRGKKFVFSRCPIGQRKISGNIFVRKILKSLPCILQKKDLWWNAMAI